MRATHSTRVGRLLFLPPNLLPSKLSPVVDVQQCKWRLGRRDGSSAMLTRGSESVNSNRKVHHRFPDTCSTTESGLRSMFKARHQGGSETTFSRDPKAMECQGLPGFGLSSEGPNRRAVAVHFGRLEDRNAPRMRSRGHQPSHIQPHPCEEIYPCYPTTIGVSGNLS
jgi:hypothetical protein